MVVALLLIAGCDSDASGVPTNLVNGSPILEPPLELGGVDGPVVMTWVETSQMHEIEFGSEITKCVERAVDDLPSGPIVIRAGVSGESVTFGSRSGHGLYGCDNSEGQREAGRLACGVAFGQLVAGRLRDPRVNVGACKTEDGAPLGFAWVEPTRRASYVTVEQDGYFEVYPTAGGLPIRVTTDEVEIERSSASFRITEHEAAGKLIRRYRLEARVAG